MKIEDLMEESAARPPLEELVLGALEGHPQPLETCRGLLRDADAAGELFEIVLGVARGLRQELESIRAQLLERVMPAMVLDRWSFGDREMLDVEIGGQRQYCALPPGESISPEAVPACSERVDGACAVRPRDDGSSTLAPDSSRPSRPGVGDEIVVSTVEGGQPVLVRATGRPYQTTGKYGMVTDIRRRDDSSHELEIEASSETFTCRASRRLEEAIARGEVDALGGLPITAVHDRGIVWDVRQPKGRAERGDEFESVTLDDFAGYDDLKERACRNLAQHLLALEPPVLVRRGELQSGLFQPAYKGLLSTGIPGTGKTFLALALIGSLRRDIGRPKLRAKIAALDLWSATHAGDDAGAKEALDRLGEALEEQYEGFARFGLPIARPALPDAADAGLAEFAGRLIDGYCVTPSGVPRKRAEWAELATQGNDHPFLFLTMRKEDFIRPFVGEGLNALSAQLRRAQNHDDLAILCIPEAEVLLGARGHAHRYYTDELMSKMLEVLEGPVACSNLFLMADGNRPDMFDTALGGRRLDVLRFPGLGVHDRPAVVRAVLQRHGAEGEECVELAHKLDDLLFGQADPICTLVMADGARRPLDVQSILTPALIRNIVRTAGNEALASGRTRIEEADIEAGWRRELDVQGQRLDEEMVSDSLGLDRKQRSRIVKLERRASA